MGKKIGLYGGSFDPIHNGHLNLAVGIMEAHHLDTVLFCPSSINPHKLHGNQAKAEDRLAMIRLAIAGEPRFCITDIEINRSGPSFTIDTLLQLRELQKGKADQDQYSIIIGEDAAKNFYRWREPEEIIKLVRLLVGRRGEKTDIESIQGSPEVVKAITEGLTPTRVMDISSTDVRQRLAKGLFCGHLLSVKVLDYIVAHSIYLPL